MKYDIKQAGEPFNKFEKSLRAFVDTHVKSWEGYKYDLGTIQGFLLHHKDEYRRSYPTANLDIIQIMVQPATEDHPERLVIKHHQAHSSYLILSVTA